MFAGGGGGGLFPDMTFFNFLCQHVKQESVGLSETVLESFPDSDKFGLSFTKNKRDTKGYNLT